jgi:hypothetical protein
MPRRVVLVLVMRYGCLRQELWPQARLFAVDAMSHVETLPCCLLLEGVASALVVAFQRKLVCFRDGCLVHVPCCVNVCGRSSVCGLAPGLVFSFLCTQSGLSW